MRDDAVVLRPTPGAASYAGVGPRPRVLLHAPPDGNCLYHCLAYPTSTHGVVRARVADWIDANWDDRFKLFVPHCERDVYRDEMRRTGTWGDELVLSAFSEIEEATVVVVDANTGRVLQTYSPDGHRTVHLLYDGSHYDLLVEETR